MHCSGDHVLQPQSESGWDVQVWLALGDSSGRPQKLPAETWPGSLDSIKGTARSCQRSYQIYLAVHAELKLQDAACSKNPGSLGTFWDGQSVPRT